MFDILKMYILILLLFPFFIIECFNKEEHHKFNFSDKIIVTEEKISDYIFIIHTSVDSIRPNENYMSIHKNKGKYNVLIKEFEPIYFTDNYKQLYMYDVNNDRLIKINDNSENELIDNIYQKNRVLDILYSMYKDEKELINSNMKLKSFIEKFPYRLFYILYEDKNKNIYYFKDSENRKEIYFYKNQEKIKEYEKEKYKFIDFILSNNNIYYLLFNKEKEEYEYYYNLNKKYIFKTKPSFCKKIDNDVYLGVGNKLYINIEEEKTYKITLVDIKKLNGELLIFFKDSSMNYFTYIENEKINIFNKTSFNQKGNFWNIIIKSDGKRNYFFKDNFALSENKKMIGYKFTPLDLEKRKQSSFRTSTALVEYIGINEHLHKRVYNYVSDIIWDSDLKSFVCFAKKTDHKLYFVKFKLKE